MVLAMIEVAALEVQERIKTVEASFTWPHPTEKNKMVAAVFVRSNDNIPYLLYCPICKSTTQIEEIIHQDTDWFRAYSSPPIKECVMTTGLVADLEGVQFYLFPLNMPKPHKIKKQDIEKFFNIKVV